MEKYIARAFHQDPTVRPGRRVQTTLRIKAVRDGRRTLVSGHASRSIQWRWGRWRLCCRTRLRNNR
ncbi:hypothetical protein BC936DRAFT_144090 [Jimgerdemannia flammicorona]|uniref:Uncharacterized protein n=1 Tax=Jimgerdemannia flammicorona TaxID=994334 RepID=A0A433DD43_9FUNG|nr:hypothetical protein BC936DRAFT_144090 [Jimgerdemannia flammicorona]